MSDNNLNNIRSFILKKKSSLPYLSTLEDAKTVITDMDHFPYTRFYRGSYLSSMPSVFEREAGWRPIHNKCYSINLPKPIAPYPNHCFQMPCSTEMPCYPQLNERIADRDAISLESNRTCIVQYR